MKPLILLVFLLFCSIVSAQSSARATVPPSPNIVEHYDRFSDMTGIMLRISIRTGLVDLGGGSVYANAQERSLELAVMAAFDGQDAKTAEPHCRLLITSESADWVYLRGPHLLQAIIDGNERWTIGEMKRVSGEVQPRGRGVIEQIALEVPFAYVQKMAKAKKLEMRVASDEFELTSSQLSDLQNLVERFSAAKNQSLK